MRTIFAHFIISIILASSAVEAAKLTFQAIKFKPSGFPESATCLIEFAEGELDSFVLTSVAKSGDENLIINNGVKLTELRKNGRERLFQLVIEFDAGAGLPFHQFEENGMWELLPITGKSSKIEKGNTFQPLLKLGDTALIGIGFGAVSDDADVVNFFK